MTSSHIFAIIVVVAVVILLINRHYQKKGVPLEYEHEEESMQHRTVRANSGLIDGSDDPFFRDSI